MVDQDALGHSPRPTVHHSVEDSAKRKVTRYREKFFLELVDASVDLVGPNSLYSLLQQSDKPKHESNKLPEIPCTAQKQCNQTKPSTNTSHKVQKELFPATNVAQRAEEVFNEAVPTTGMKQINYVASHHICNPIPGSNECRATCENNVQCQERSASNSTSNHLRYQERSANNSSSTHVRNQERSANNSSSNQDSTTSPESTLPTALQRKDGKGSLKPTTRQSPEAIQTFFPTGWKQQHIVDEQSELNYNNTHHPHIQSKLTLKRLRQGSNRAMRRARNFFNEFSIHRSRNMITQSDDTNIQNGLLMNLFRNSALASIEQVSNAKSQERWLRRLVENEIQSSKEMLPVHFASEHSLDDILREKVSKYLQRAAFLITRLIERKAFSKWQQFLFQFKVQLKLQYTIQIQAVMRQFLARKLLAKLYAKEQYNRRTELSTVMRALNKRKRNALVIERFGKRVLWIQAEWQYRTQRRKIMSVQRYWRCRRAKIHLIMARLEHARKENAAIKIQKVFRGCLGRKIYVQVSYEAFIEKIQLELDDWDGMISKRFIEQGAALVIQKCFKHYKVWGKGVKFNGHTMCERIQKVWRGYSARKLYKPKLEQRIKARSKQQLPDRLASEIVVNGTIENLEMNRMSQETGVVDGTIKIKSENIDPNRPRYSHPLYKRSATKMQRFVRSRFARRKYLNLYIKNLVMQSVVRMYFSRRKAQCRQEYLRKLAHYKVTGKLQYETQLLPALELRLLLAPFYPDADPHGHNEVHFIYDYWISNAVSNVSGMTNGMVVRLMKEVKVLKRVTQQQIDLLFADILVKVHARNEGAPKTKVVDLYGFRAILVGLANMVFGRMASREKDGKPRKRGMRKKADNAEPDTQNKNNEQTGPKQRRRSSVRSVRQNEAVEDPIRVDPLCNISQKERVLVGRLFNEVIFTSKLGKLVKNHLVQRTATETNGAARMFQRTFRIKYYAERSFQTVASYVVRDVRMAAQESWAISVLQNAVRKRIARNKLLALAQHTIICYKSIDDSHPPYWYNPKSGSKFEKLPKILRGKPSLDTIFIPPLEEQYVITCTFCNLRSVQKCCTECGMEMYCDQCFESSHSRGARAKHPVAQVATCVECLFQMGTRICNTCKDAYCDTCFIYCHATGGMKSHYYKPLVVMCEYCTDDTVRRCARWYYSEVKYCVPCFNQRFSYDYYHPAWEERVKLPFQSTEIQSVIREELEKKRQAELQRYTESLQEKQEEEKLLNAVKKVQARFRGRRERLHGKGVQVLDRLHEVEIQRKAKAQGTFKTLFNKTQHFLWGPGGLLNPDFGMNAATTTSQRGGPNWTRNGSSRNELDNGKTNEAEDLDTIAARPLLKSKSVRKPKSSSKRKVKSRSKTTKSLNSKSSTTSFKSKPVSKKGKATQGRSKSRGIGVAVED